MPKRYKTTQTHIPFGKKGINIHGWFGRNPRHGSGSTYRKGQTHRKGSILGSVRGGYRKR